MVSVSAVVGPSHAQLEGGGRVEPVVVPAECLP